jgi:sterol desaturase/sphingolipid hydroxylase (fatty acid hydroxylase superfamily)
MIDLLNKNLLPNYFYNQFIPSMMVVVFAILLCYKKYSPLYIILCINFLFIYSYLIHRLFHNLPKPLNIHIDYHHKIVENNYKKYFNLIIELIANIMFFMLLYLIQHFTNIYLIPNILIFYYGFIYVSVHIINYSILHVSEEHVIHHKTSNEDSRITYNYGPDLIDHIFSSNYSREFENYNHIIPNVLIAFLMSYMKN